MIKNDVKLLLCPRCWMMILSRSVSLFLSRYTVYLRVIIALCWGCKFSVELTKRSCRKLKKSTCLPNFFTKMISHLGSVSDVVILLTWNLHTEPHGGLQTDPYKLPSAPQQSSNSSRYTPHKKKHLSHLFLHILSTWVFSHLDVFQTFFSSIHAVEIRHFTVFWGVNMLIHHVDAMKWLDSLPTQDTRLKRHQPDV